jgi:hypothetical protein
MHPTTRPAPIPGEVERDGVAAAALTVVRRACVEGVAVTREGFEHEASVTLGRPAPDAMSHVDAVAQQLGVSCMR